MTQGIPSQCRRHRWAIGYIAIVVTIELILIILTTGGVL